MMMAILSISNTARPIRLIWNSCWPMARHTQTRTHTGVATGLKISWCEVRASLSVFSIRMPPSDGLAHHCGMNAVG
jgi:hypothetical protein